MDGSKPSAGENPPVKSPKKRLNKAHNPPKPVFPNTSPAAMNQRKGEAVTVARSRLGASKNSKVNSGTKKVIPLHGDCSSSQNAHPHQKSAISTVEINVNDRLRNASNIELAGDGFPAGQSGNAGYQNARTNEDISLAPSVLYGYQSTDSILKSLNPGTQNSSEVKKDDNLQSGQIGPQPLIGNLSPPSEEQVSIVLAHSTKTIDHIDQLKIPVLHHLAGQEVPVNQLLQNQYQTTPGIQKIDPQASNPILQGPIPLNIQIGDSAVTELSGARPNVKDTYGALMGIQSGLQISHDQQEGTRQENSHAPTQKIKDQSLSLDIQKAANQKAALASTDSNAIIDKGNSPPPPATITHSYVTRLRARHEAEIKPIAFTPPKITTKQGQPAVIFKREDYMVKFANRCKFTVVGKFSNTMPRMEIIRKSFIAQTQLRGPVKIAHFNARTVYIDLENEYDHSTVWGKALYLDLASFQKTRGSVAKVKIQIDLTKERPHHVWLGYDEEQDENGDGEWLEVQYDSLPAYCTHCRHLGHSEYTCEIRLKDEDKKKRKEEEQKVSGNPHNAAPGTSKGMQQTTQKRKNFKANTQPKRQQQVYMPKQPEAKQQKVAPNDIQQQTTQTPVHSGIPAINPPAQLERSVDPVAQDHPIPSIPPSSSADCGVNGGMETCQGKLSNSQGGVPNGEGFPHVLHECANAQLADHRIDQQTPATTLTNSDTQQIDQYDSVTVEEDSESLSSEENPTAQMKALLNGKAKAVADFQVQTQKSRN
ncbi:hypothetical protein A4A49_41049 [Nicotiana attenuata]|uniref:DUF4283 domain-containing protein n=1 Tax=Nicotiana attenuata TaxID=49451 RepID=A0A1J6JVD2_NICAT|nr:hypothetical protein A4A49_41049 [Nicotiana attenuata]